jgi:hypothetical protein
MEDSFGTYLFDIGTLNCDNFFDKPTTIKIDDDDNNYDNQRQQYDTN